MRAAHDPAEGLHLREALALPGGARADLLFGMGHRSGHRALPRQRRAQGNRAARARAQGRQGGGQALRPRHLTALVVGCSLGDAAGAVVMLATFPAKLELSRVGTAVLLRRHGCRSPAVISFPVIHQGEEPWAPLAAPSWARPPPVS